MHGWRRKLEISQLGGVRPPLREAGGCTHWVRPRMHRNGVSHCSSHVDDCVPGRS